MYIEYSQVIHVITVYRELFSFSVDGFVLANSVDPDEMPHCAATFHPGLHCWKRAHLGVTSIQKVKKSCAVA